MGHRKARVRSRFRMLAIVGSLLGACSFPDYGFVPQFTGGTGAGGSGGSGLTAGTAADGGVGAVPNGGSGGSNGSGAESGDAGMAGDAAGGTSAGGTSATGGAGGSVSEGGAGAGGEGGTIEPPPPPLLCDAIQDVPAACTCVDHDDHAYFFCTSSFSFGTAANLCGEYGLKLVKIDSFSEDEWLKGEVQADGLSWPWIGASSQEMAGTWTWPDGEVFWIGDQSGSSQGGNYAMWRAGAPGSASTTYCGYLGGSGWDFDGNCSSNRDWICEAY